MFGKVSQFEPICFFFFFFGNSFDVYMLFCGAGDFQAF